MVDLFDLNRKPIFDFQTEFFYYNISFVQKEYLILIHELYAVEMFRIIRREEVG